MKSGKIQLCSRSLVIASIVIYEKFSGAVRSGRVEWRCVVSLGVELEAWGGGVRSVSLFPHAEMNSRL
ncbi:MAG: hypothetical protein ACKESB_00615 [Candidatus Hodgkinia cicadicola]